MILNFFLTLAYLVILFLSAVQCIDYLGSDFLSTVFSENTALFIYKLDLVIFLILGFFLIKISKRFSVDKICKGFLAFTLGAISFYGFLVLPRLDQISVDGLANTIINIVDDNLYLLILADIIRDSAVFSFHVLTRVCGPTLFLLLSWSTLNKHKTFKSAIKYYFMLGLILSVSLLVKPYIQQDNSDNLLAYMTLLSILSAILWLGNRNQLKYQYK